jgi:hypothetical protein
MSEDHRSNGKNRRADPNDDAVFFSEMNGVAFMTVINRYPLRA